VLVERAKDRTLEEIGHDLDVTRERVRGIETKALRKCKQHIEANDNLQAERAKQAIEASTYYATPMGPPDPTPEEIEAQAAAAVEEQRLALDQIKKAEDEARIARYYERQRRWKEFEAEVEAAGGWKE
jgi:hypothetical protein